ncbi:MAG TPA: hypothetical protein PLY74_11025 [Methanothrix soehngenii]|jgi:hypothetical protein|nr:hypothetical protein [Methanothrix soehngenii]
MADKHFGLPKICGVPKLICSPSKPGHIVQNMKLKKKKVRYILRQLRSIAWKGKALQWIPVVEEIGWDNTATEMPAFGISACRDKSPFTLPRARHLASLMADTEDARVSSIVDLVSRPNS